MYTGPRARVPALDVGYLNKYSRPFFTIACLTWPLLGVDTDHVAAVLGAGSTVRPIRLIQATSDSVLTPSGQWAHNGSEWPGQRVLETFTATKTRHKGCGKEKKGRMVTE